MSRIYLSTGAFPKRSLMETAEICERLGTGIELSSGANWHAGLAAEIDALARLGCDVLIHNYFPPPEKPFVLNLASSNQETLGRSIAHVRHALDLSQRFGAPFYSVHGGFAIELAAEDLGSPSGRERRKRVPLEQARRVFEQSIRELSAHAEERGVRLLVENNVLLHEQAAEAEPQLLLTTPAEIAAFFRALDCAGVGLLLDVGHAKVTAAALGIDPVAYFEQLAPWIGAVHLSDNDGVHDNNRPMGTEAWFAKHLRREIPAVIEVYRLTEDQAREQVQIVTEWRA